MTEKTEIIVGKGVVGTTVFNGKLVVAPLHAEDAGKRECIAKQAGDLTVPSSEMIALATGMFGLWGGKAEIEDGPRVDQFAPITFKREFQEETRQDGLPDIELATEQLQKNPVYAGRIEQLRKNDGKVMFYVFALPLVELTWEQMNELSKRRKPGEELLEIPLLKLADFMNEKNGLIRPASVLAIQSLLSQFPEQKPHRRPIAVPRPTIFSSLQRVGVGAA